MRERVEYIGGPRAGTGGELDGLPEELVEPDGRYVRSVRCADDGAMRYVWRDASPTIVTTESEGDAKWRTGS